MKLSEPTDKKRHPEITETTVTQVISAKEASGESQKLSPENMLRLGSYFCRTVASCCKFEPK